MLRYYTIFDIHVPVWTATTAMTKRYWDRYCLRAKYRYTAQAYCILAVQEVKGYQFMLNCHVCSLAKFAKLKLTRCVPHKQNMIIFGPCVG